MGRSYAQLSLEDRCEISRLHAAGSPIRQIAAALDRAPSTIARELKRNSGRKVGYKPAYAHEQSRARRWSAARLQRDHQLRDQVLDGLKRGWSPEQVAGRLARQAGRNVISHETIYRFVYAQLARTQDFSWRLLLPRGKSKRGWRGRRGGSPAGFISGRVPIAERPADINTRANPGHWEADLMLFATYGQAILVCHERLSRALFAHRPPGKAAQPIADILRTLFAALPPELRQTVTFDNGTEFARHTDLHQLDIDTYFCDPHAPWQKGGIENAIGRIRRFIPRKTDLDTLYDDRLHAALRSYNTTPRKCLDFRTPAEVFLDQLLHFKCESTCRPAPARRRRLGAATSPRRQ